ncbi:follitropin subunit beta [Megalobrama amblycephala]|uniref:follitropin subunit beta n=1 Tax=Megalobrama amblycephala TaxID=75352 RepID=UPI0020145287|nr:follitropin subunit beta [Megalobrama amblycephala]XP_048039309.1 follitropin subunit beta [Megalobrama amblycephala]
MRMRFVVMVMLLPALMRAGSECRSSCRLTNISITMESEECGSCITIDTTACAGFCTTQDRVYRSPMMQNYQNTCNIIEWTYNTYEFKRCPPGIDSVFTYPVALSCECSKCNSDIADCGALSQQTSSCTVH